TPRAENVFPVTRKRTTPTGGPLSSVTLQCDCICIHIGLSGVDAVASLKFKKVAVRSLTRSPLFFCIHIPQQSGGCGCCGFLHLTFVVALSVRLPCGRSPSLIVPTPAGRQGL